jgi:hypothetical protein
MHSLVIPSAAVMPFIATPRSDGLEIHALKAAINVGAII